MQGLLSSQSFPGPLPSVGSSSVGASIQPYLSITVSPFSSTGSRLLYEKATPWSTQFIISADENT